MDPISALSLAANIFQVIGFTNDVVAISKRIYDAGSPAGLSELEQIAADALNTADGITTRLDACGPVPPGSADSVLLRLGQEAVLIAQELKLLLEKLRAMGAGGKPWHALRQIFMTIWRRDDIDKLEKRLVAVRGELQFHAVASIQKKLDQHSLQLEDVVGKLDHQAQAVIPQLFDQLDRIKSQNDTILDNQTHYENVARNRHEELMGVVKGAKHQPGQPLSTNARPSPEDIESAQKTILASLWFATMQDREDEIHQAYHKTYEWLFCDPVTHEKPWDSFCTFLSDEADIYWITGKAGSGKSTLTKFAVQHGATTEALLRWTDGKGLNRAGFYFYYKGTKLEKSEAGVLRSLLHRILSRRHELIKFAFPERFEVCCLDEHRGKIFEPTYPELKRALEALLKSCPDERFFFSVDGLDEYDAGNHQMGELVDVFKALSKLPNVKFLLTSRPWAVFEERLTGYSRLRLHELTRPDITNFVDWQIEEHPSSRTMTDSDRSLINSLRDEIVENSAGVFLWVYLVVRSLVEGLNNGDSIDELRGRILELPTDLEDLYLYMWIRIPKRYQSQVSRLLQILSFGTSEGARISLLGLALTEILDEEAVFTLPVAPLGKEEAHRLMRAMETRIAGQCFGIIEVQRLEVGLDRRTPRLGSDRYPNNVESEFGNPFVTFIHRSVFDFVSSPEIGAKLKEATVGRSGDVFEAESALLRLLVLRTKTFDGDSYFRGIEEGNVFPSPLERLVFNALTTCRQAERATGKAQTHLITELDKTMTHLYHNVYNCPDTYHWSNSRRLQGGIGEEGTMTVPQLMASQSDMLSLAVRHGLVCFVKNNPTAVSESVKNKPGRPLLDYALRPHCGAIAFEEELEFYPSLEMVAFLLDKGARPSQKAAGKSLMWHFASGLSEEVHIAFRQVTVAHMEEVAGIIMLLLPYVRECGLEALDLKKLEYTLSIIPHRRDVDEDVERAKQVLDELYCEAVKPVGPRPRSSHLVKKLFCCFGG